MQGDRSFYSQFTFPFIEQYLMMLFPLYKLPEISLFLSVGKNWCLAMCNSSPLCFLFISSIFHTPLPQTLNFLHSLYLFWKCFPSLWSDEMAFMKCNSFFTPPIFCFDSIVLIFNEDLLIVLEGLGNCIFSFTECKETCVGFTLLMLLLSLPLLLIVPVYF